MTEQEWLAFPSTPRQETGERSVVDASKAKGLSMTATYNARYKDRVGTEATTILNDGGMLSMVVRGVRFQGSDFDSFEPQDAFHPAQLSSFTFLHGSLCNCIIEADIAVPVVTPARIIDGLLSFELDLGVPLPIGQLDP